jgi:hypothetical protein
MVQGEVGQHGCVPKVGLRSASEPSIREAISMVAQSPLEHLHNGISGPALAPTEGDVTRVLDGPAPTKANGA